MIQELLGKTITLNSRIFSVVGVAPKKFSGLLRGMQTDVWITLPHQAISKAIQNS